jgi:membrane protease YdiL (CAAX protease family)
MTGEKPSGSAWGIVHGGLLLVLFWLSATVLPQPILWPWYLLVPLAAYSVLVLIISPLRRSFPGISLGRVNHAGVAATLGITLVSCGVLIGYQTLFAPDVSALKAVLPSTMLGNLVLAGLCFSLGNAVLEELIFRGVLYDALAGGWDALTAILVSAVIFGIVHARGYPSGQLGIVLAGLYGAALGLLRWWSGGLGLGIGSHVCADATIFGILASAGSSA